jgi:alanyl aminopeptidase
VTPAWWDDLWLAEAFATWLAGRTAASLRPPFLPGIAHGDRARALDADHQVDAQPIAHPITKLDDIEPAFDDITYLKGAAVLAMFERFAGASAFQSAIRRYLARHAGTSVSSQAFIDALAAATTPAVGAALASNVVHAGLPVVELELRCGAGAAIVASARDAVTTPVCVRYPVSAGTERACFLAEPHGALALPAAAGCPAWVVGNDSGSGYYRTVWWGRVVGPHGAAADRGAVVRGAPRARRRHRGRNLARRRRNPGGAR